MQLSNRTFAKITGGSNGSKLLHIGLQMKGLRRNDDDQLFSRRYYNNQAWN